MAHDRCYLEPGDLIEIFRPLYQHWALYLGDGYVIHFTDTGEGSWSLSVGSVRAKKGIVKKELLKDVVKDNVWRVNNKYDRSRTPLPVEEIIWCAERWIGREMLYNVFAYNCEHFVTELRYGKKFSSQV
ncbi:PA216 protein, partial [Dyaphorophyia castanea]|nr:PA216 protein [Platysteira castanea]